MAEKDKKNKEKKVKDKTKKNEKVVKADKKETKAKAKSKTKNKVTKETKVKKLDKKDNKDNKVSEECSVYCKTRYAFIYFFIAIMFASLVAVGFYMLNEKYSLIYKKPIATIELENLGSFKVELEPIKAPNTVAHFVKLAEAGFYDGKVVYGKDAVSLHFGRGPKGEEIKPKTSLIDSNVVPDSIQDYEYEIDGEFEANNFKDNDIKHDKYVISLVRADYSEILQKIQHYSYNSGTAMFKILLDDAPGMNGHYTAFGKVIEGFDVVDKLAKTELRFEPETEEDKADLNEFKDFVKIKSVNVETFGRKFKNVKTHKRFNLEEFIIEIYKDKFL